MSAGAPDKPNVKPTAKPVDKNARLARRLVLVTGGMAGLAYASAPLYDMFCRATGFAGTPQVAQEGDRPILDRTVRVRFDSNVDPNLPWRFEPLEREVKVRLGEEHLTNYRVTNISQRPIVGTATYNVTPETAGPWFNKIQCFCFTEQLLLPGQSVDMPVIFFVDPEMDKDRRYDNIRTVTLSYTFYEAKTERARTLLGGLSANGTGKGG
jgi:cytochrome c oxidase assembly protein subunit 11